MKRTGLLALVSVLGVASLGLSATLRDFPPEWDRKAALENGWIYDDLPAGLAKAKETGKPLMVVLRCPP